MAVGSIETIISPSGFLVGPRAATAPEMAMAVTMTITNLGMMIFRVFEYWVDALVEMDRRHGVGGGGAISSLNLAPWHCQADYFWWPAAAAIANAAPGHGETPAAIR
jgi:hypothetical protein